VVEWDTCSIIDEDIRCTSPTLAACLNRFWDGGMIIAGAASRPIDTMAHTEIDDKLFSYTVSMEKSGAVLVYTQICTCNCVLFLA